MLDMSDYEMGYQDYIDGFPPIIDLTDSEEDREYMRGYNDAKKKGGQNG